MRLLTHKAPVSAAPWARISLEILASLANHTVLHVRAVQPTVRLVS